MVGDRGMLTSARIEQDLGPDGVDWISALRAPQIRRLAEEGALQLSLFDKRDLAEIKSADSESSIESKKRRAREKESRAKRL